MILATDVNYKESTATVAGVVFNDWNEIAPEEELRCTVENIEPYESGSFYKRELPCILALVKKHNLEVDYIVIDGYVFLDENNKPGLGKHLFNALNESVAVIGVAKTPFQGIRDKHKLFRGKSSKPLYI